MAFAVPTVCRLPILRSVDELFGPRLANRVGNMTNCQIPLFLVVQGAEAKTPAVLFLSCMASIRCNT